MRLIDDEQRHAGASDPRAERGVIESLGCDIQQLGAAIDGVVQRLVQFPYAPYLGAVNVNSNSTKTPFNFFLEARMKM